MIGLERALFYTATATQMTWREVDPSEPLALARLACQTPSGDHEHAALLAVVDELVARAQEAYEATQDPRAAQPGAITAHVVAGTPEAGVPQVGC